MSTQPNRNPPPLSGIFTFGTPKPGTRDPKYYFKDGSTVLLVGGYLFKIQCSLLTSQSKVFEDMFSLPKQPKPGSPGSSCNDLEGGSDTNPIKIPGIQAAQFRNLLLFFYGNMTDPDYRSLVLGVTNETRFGSWFGLSASFKRYLDIASLAHRFCMDSVETWALGQFKGVMQSAKGISNLSPDYTDLFGALEYSKLTPDRELERDARNLAQCYISNTNSATRTLPPNTISCNTLVRIYKDPLLKQKDPALFGHVFCVVLSAGYLSLIWKALTRDDRSKLLAAQVYLTPLPSTLPTGWIHNLSEISEAINTQSRQNCFVNCSRSFINRFTQVINSPDFLKDSPLVGVTAVSKLATHRQSMAETFKVAKCTCASQLLTMIDLKMDALLTELAETYHDRID